MTKQKKKKKEVGVKRGRRAKKGKRDRVKK